MAEHSFYEFFVLVYGIEQGLHVNLAFGAGGVGIHLDKSAGELLAVERCRVERGAVVEIEFARDFLHRGIQEDVALVKDDDGVDDVLEILHLMGGDDDDAIFAGEAHYGLAELCL